MKITDPAHAVRVLEALVEQGEMNFQISTTDIDDVPTLEHLIFMRKALVEGAKAILEMQIIPYTDTKIESAVAEERGLLALKLAQAYAPRMLEAGMSIPD